MRRQSFGALAKSLLTLAVTGATVLAVAVVFAQPDPYGDEPAARPAPRAKPAPRPAAKPGKPKMPVPDPSIRRRPDPHAAPPGRRAPTPLRPPTRRPPRPRPGPPGHGTPGHDHGSHQPAGDASHGEAAGKHGAAQCPGHGPTDRPGPINLLHGWAGVDNEKAVSSPPGVRAGSWAWWKWRLTPYLWRYQNEKDRCDPRNTPTPLIAPIFNFAVLAFILFRFGRKPLQDALRKRKVSIMSEIENAREIKDKAQDRLDHYESELDHLDDKLGALRAQYAAEGADEKKNIVRDAGEARDRMMADAEFRVSQEAKVARDELSREAMEQALAAAGALLEQRVNQQDHDRLAEEYLSQIGPALRQQGLADRKGGRQ